MKAHVLFLLFFIGGSFIVTGQPFVGSYYTPDGRDGMVITLKEENGLFSGTFRGEGEVYQVECRFASLSASTSVQPPNVYPRGSRLKPVIHSF